MLESPFEYGPFSKRGSPRRGKVYFAEDIHVLLKGTGDRWVRLPTPGSEGYAYTESDDFVVLPQATNATPIIAKTVYQWNIVVPARVNGIQGSIGVITMPLGSGAFTTSCKLNWGYPISGGLIDGTNGQITLDSNMTCTAWFRFMWPVVPTTAQNIQLSCTIGEGSGSYGGATVNAGGLQIGYQDGAAGGASAGQPLQVPTWEASVWYVLRVKLSTKIVECGLKKAGGDYIVTGRASTLTEIPAAGSKMGLNITGWSALGANNKEIYLDGWNLLVEYGDKAHR